MRKPDGLRRLLCQWLPELSQAPERLLLFAGNGHIAARATGTLGFEYRYQLDVTILDFAGDPSAVVVPLLAWVAEQQPDLMERAPHQPIAFEAEHLAPGLQDMRFTLDLTERVAVPAKPGGGYELTFRDQPPSEDAFDGACNARLWQLKAGGVVVAQTSDPAFIP